MILVTGNTGYIGPVMTKLLKQHSYEVEGLDTKYFEGCDFFPPENLPTKQIIKDIRDVNEQDLKGITSIIHLAGLSNDPLGEINPTLTPEINYVASINLAKLAKKIGIKRFIFASSCSLYGIASNNKPLTEEGKLNPITAYAKAKAMVEEEVSKLADDNFHPVFMRNSTVYGLSPNLRLDLVVNNLVAGAYLTGKVTVLSDGTPWRPIIHVEDFCRAFIAVLEAPFEKIHNQAFNVGINEENYQVIDIATTVAEIVPDCHVEVLNKTGSDERTYCVDFSKISKINFKPSWNLRKGIGELYNTFKDLGLTLEDLQTSKYFRVRKINELMENEKIDKDLRWK
ncbi:MAG: NAD(P)-dependent oxidoreductase [Nitrospirota bacterium]|nr:NAD(P)-dependent oxidoreductase [Nitrospirota bacterium]